MPQDESCCRIVIPFIISLDCRGCCSCSIAICPLPDCIAKKVVPITTVMK